MARGHVAKREAKKPKKKEIRKAVELPPIVASSEVEVVGKRKKNREREEEEN